MANISKEQKETLALIDAIMAMFENKDNMSSENKNDDQVSSDNNITNEIDNKISINTGTKEELMTLKGIGEAAFNKIKDNIKL